MGGRTTHELDLIVLGLVGVFVVNAALVWFRHYSISWLGERVVADLRGLVFDRVLTLPLAWFHERRSGELVGRLAADVTVIEGTRVVEQGRHDELMARRGTYRRLVEHQQIADQPPAA